LTIGGLAVIVSSMACLFTIQRGNPCVRRDVACLGVVEKKR